MSTTIKRRQKGKKTRGPIYSVVDLETTGTSVNHGDRIIQVGCILVQDGEIINHFETKINPQMTIPRQITQLTGIKNSDVRHAPLFDDVAGTLYSLLSGTIFVAHNVNFDFPFLNAELERAGYPSLSIEAIDTVTLSQILMPTAKSYRLRDLTSSLSIEHSHPHSAVSDAEATAHLLVDLMKRLRELPTLTLEKLVELKLNLPQQTTMILDEELERRVTSPLPLSDELYVSHGIVLHKVRPATSQGKVVNVRYPSTKRAKLKLYGEMLEFRPTQSKMMNSIYNNYTHDAPKSMIVEAGTGTGKTLGYLLPLAYAAYPNKKIVVSTATNLLQQQIAQQAMKQLNRILPFELNGVVVKGNSHYLDLAKFVHSLSIIEDSDYIQLIKAKILVWLLGTTSGDLDELNLNAQRSPYFAEIRHQGVKTLREDNEFYKDDFLIRRQKQLHTANVIITNHSYLVDHAQELGDGTRRPYLVVDEAQHLSESILRRSRQILDFQNIRTAIHVLKNLVSNNQERNLANIFEEHALGSYNVELLRDDLRALNEANDAFQQALYRQFMLNIQSNPNELIEQPLDNQQLLSLLTPTSKPIMQLEQALASIQLHFVALRHLFEQQADRWLFSDRYLMSQFQSQWFVPADADNKLHQFIETLEERGSSAAFWLTVQQSTEHSSMKLSGGLLTANHFLTENVYPYFAQPLFVGATLFTSSRSNYLYEQLDLERSQTLQKRFASPFNYAEKAKLLIAKDAPTPNRTNNEEYIHYLAQTIYDLCKDNECQTMILFNSLVTIEQVYSQLKETDLFDQRDILAQGITGRREKLLKQFASGTSSILLGASSFWEGIDLPKNALELLIVTRLPFDSPDEIMNRAYNDLLKREGKNPFYHSSLPKATMRLQQGIGRLLRTPEDFGVGVILDSRISTRRYGYSMLKNLPKCLPVEELPTTKVVESAKNFLKKQRTNNES
ncbi:DEAD/DEAH box helicase [Limosilactobacillus sp. Sa3CUN2]|uniref:3'-5' exonuclease DinG n=1 Tax=Limosilactobacillus avistercoris TaxID=2762243 RepID=A0ABR8PEW8_9LACO|nr:helicase C-terminal domain-containing protein [Limosilactobacillus avistercoris]MBD7895738.1 DEAD/DEAH box helicase [Limosilactobacillus avistercoris]